MLPKTDNRDIAETITKRDRGNLEDEIFEAADKVQALCAVQLQVEQGEGRLPEQTRAHYAMVLDEQARRLIALLERHFE